MLRQCTRLAGLKPRFLDDLAIHLYHIDKDQSERHQPCFLTSKQGIMEQLLLD